MTHDQIRASAKALQPAPENETLHQIAVRAAHWLLGTIADQHPAIAQTQALYARVVDDGGLRMPPSEAEWKANIDDLARASARASASAIALTFARARARDLDSAALARARAIALALALALAIVKLMGDRLQPLPHLDRAVLDAVETPGCSLDMASWHQCQTTHCRAGWAITLHPMGSEMERAFGPWMAGAAIYLRSTGAVPNFFADDSSALADIRRGAAEADASAAVRAIHDAAWASASSVIYPKD
jgi:hypothetical protein